MFGQELNYDLPVSDNLRNLRKYTMVGSFLLD